MGGKKAPGKEKGGGGKFQADDPYDHDLYRDIDYDHGSGIFKYVSKWFLPFCLTAE